MSKVIKKMQKLFGNILATFSSNVQMIWISVWEIGLDVETYKNTFGVHE